MFKRLFWLTVGAGFGFGSSFWATRRAREAAARYTPPRLALAAAGSARSLGRDLRGAVHEGRVAMHEREAELRAEVEGRLLTPELERRLRAELLERSLPPDVRAELIRRSLPPGFEDALVGNRLSPDVEEQLRRELVGPRRRPRRIRRGAVVDVDIVEVRGRLTGA